LTKFVRDKRKKAKKLRMRNKIMMACLLMHATPWNAASRLHSEPHPSRAMEVPCSCRYP
jgi:hypothetical protein